MRHMHFAILPKSNTFSFASPQFFLTSGQLFFFSIRLCNEEMLFLIVQNNNNRSGMIVRDTYLTFTVRLLLSFFRYTKQKNTREKFLKSTKMFMLTLQLNS
jgi:hypothetical protein